MGTLALSRDLKGSFTGGLWVVLAVAQTLASSEVPKPWLLDCPDRRLAQALDAIPYTLSRQARYAS